MSNEQLNLIAHLYLLGLFIDLVWYFCRVGGMSGFKSMIREMADEVKVTDGLVLAVVVPITMLLIAAWPISIHLDILRSKSKT